jgi:uncharacterized protein YndB with AHSA1/START domain
MSVATETRSVILERELPHPPEKVWRALTQPHLIEAWLMKNDFAPVMGQRFTLTGDWGSVDCEVTRLEPNMALAYTWSAMGLKTMVEFSLTPTSGGTRLRVEQSGFPADAASDRYYNGAQWGWQKFIASLEDVVAGLD